MSETFEWLRPGWLLALPVGAALLWAWWRARAGDRPWRRLVDPELLAHLTDGAPRASARLALALAGSALALACVALSGPAWRPQPVPLTRDLGTRVIVLDLSASMDAVDVVPSRLKRARGAIATILRASPEAQLGLVVFAADAFSVAPLMSDPATLVHLLGHLDTATLPRAGARPDLGLEMAHAMLTRSGAAAGDVILVGDSPGDERTLAAARALARAGFPLSVLAIGTPHGGPVRLGSGAFAMSEAGDVVISDLDVAALERIARAGSGRFHLLSGTEATPQFAGSARARSESANAPTHALKVRHDDGAWFVLAALPFAALLFRRGWLAGIAALAIVLPPQAAHAFDWSDLWRRADQQAAAEFATGRFGDNAWLLSKVGSGSPWRAMLLYRGGRFEEAAAEFGTGDTADAHYNRGNALALDGRLEAALAAYDAALERSPGTRDALFNRSVVRDALANRRAQAQSRDGDQGGQTAMPRRSEAAPPGRAGAGGGSGSRNSSQDRGRGESRPGIQPGSRRAEAGDGSISARASPEDAGRRPEDGIDGKELRRLEGLLARIPDEPGTLLANRFKRQLSLRKVLDRDTGARW